MEEIKVSSQINSYIDQLNNIPVPKSRDLSEKQAKEIEKLLNDISALAKEAQKENLGAWNTAIEKINVLEKEWDSLENISILFKDFLCCNPLQNQQKASWIELFKNKCPYMYNLVKEEFSIDVFKINLNHEIYTGYEWDQELPSALSLHLKYRRGFLIEFIGYLENDLEDLATKYLFDRNHIKKINICSTDADFHRKAKNALRVNIDLNNDQNITFIYKPRSLKMDALLYDVDQALTDANIFPRRRIIDKENHGYDEFITGGPVVFEFCDAYFKVREKEENESIKTDNNQAVKGRSPPTSSLTIVPNR